MECPSNELLLNFIQDPDAVVEEHPWFERHLELCARCRSSLDELSADQSAATLWMHVLGDKSEMPVQLPEVAGYEVEQQVSSGGFGTVFRGVQQSTGRSVAIKFISQASPSRAERLSVERTALLQLDHPHVVALIDAGSSPAGVFIVYPWMETNLSSYIKSNDPAELMEVLDLLIPICEAVCHLHSHEIIHRDIKPSNVLLNSRGQPKLADFGLAKDLSDRSPSSTLTEPVGTPGYMAPEQTGLVADRVGYETDVYGLGALMYAMTAGRPPFQAANNLHVIHQVIHELPLPLRRLRPDASVDYETVCMKCLSKQKSQRYHSAYELLEDLKRLQRGERVLARPVSLYRKARHWLARRPVLRNSALAFIALLAVSISGLLYVQNQLQVQANRGLLHLTVERLLDADESELRKIYDSLVAQPEAELLRELNAVNSDTEVKKLRVALVSRTKSVSRQTLVQGVEQCDVRELPLIRAQIETRVRLSEDAEAQIGSEIHHEQRLEMILRLAAACPLKPGTFDSRLCSRLVAAVGQRDESELQLWRECLRPYASELTRQLIAMLDELEPNGPVERSVYDHQTVDLQMATRLCLMWNVEQPEWIVKILERSSPSLISFIKQHPELLTDQLKTCARRRWQELVEFEKSLGQGTDNQALQALSSKYHGVASSRGGYLTKVLAEDIEQVLQTLASQGCCAVSAYPLLDQEIEAYSICYRSMPGRSDLSRCQSPEEVWSAIDQRKAAGWVPVSIWVGPGQQEFNVLWSSVQELGGTLHEAGSTSSDLDSESFASRTPTDRSLLTFLWNDRIFSFERPLAMVVDSRLKSMANSLKEERPRKSVRVERSNFLRVELNQANLERFIRSSRIQQLSVTGVDLDDLQRKVGELVSEGLLPSDVFFDRDYRPRAFYEFDRQLIEQNHAYRANCALVCCLAGDYEPLLADLQCRSFAYVRGTLVGELKPVSSIERLFQLLEEVELPDQISALLVASSDMDWTNLSIDQRSAIERQLRRLVEHDDSGVHFAAMWILRTRMGRKIDPQTFASRKAIKQHRSWFYSASGIPFVVIHPQKLQILSGENRVPWTQRVLSNAVYCQQAFAISAVEISWQEVSRFQHTSRFSSERGIETGQTPEPMTLISYPNMLEYCRSLSEAEGLDGSGVVALTHSDTSPELISEEALLRCEAYRLPTGIEWEIASRCGSITPTFFGDNLEYLSTYAWNSSNTDLAPMPIAQLAPSPWGLHDILGNVYEANLGDHYALEGAMSGRSNYHYGFWDDMTVNVRGGSFLSHRVYCTSGVPHGIPQKSMDRNVGFRIVRTLR